MDRITGQTAILPTENELQRTNHILESYLIDQFNWIHLNPVFFYSLKICKVIIMLQQKVLNSVNTDTYVKAEKNYMSK